MKILKTTRSICPRCFKELEAEIFCRDKSIFMRKFCEKHGQFEVLLEKDVRFYNALTKNFKKQNKTFVRDIKIPITYRCNLNCKFCYLPYRNKDRNLNFLKTIIDGFSGKDILLLGGEPTLRNDLFCLISYIRKKNKRAILTTNGLRLEDKNYVKRLKKSGLDIVILPLNSLNKENFKKIEGDIVLESKLKALSNLKKNNIKIILGSVLIKDINYTELRDIFDYCLKDLDYIIGWRIKVGVEIGRYETKEPLFISEILNRLCKIIVNRFNFQISLNSIIENLNKKNNLDLLSCKFDLFLILLKKENDITLLDIKFKRPSLFNFYLGFLFRNLIDSFRTFNFKDFFNCFKNSFLGKRKNIKVFPIRIRRWPTKFTWDLNEINCCRSQGLAEDGKVYPFCYSLIINEKMMNKKKRN